MLLVESVRCTTTEAAAGDDDVIGGVCGRDSGLPLAAPALDDDDDDDDDDDSKGADAPESARTITGLTGKVDDIERRDGQRAHGKCGRQFDDVRMSEEEDVTTPPEADTTALLWRDGRPLAFYVSRTFEGHIAEVKELVKASFIVFCVYFFFLAR